MIAKKLNVITVVKVKEINAVTIVEEINSVNIVDEIRAVIVVGVINVAVFMKEVHVVICYQRWGKILEYIGRDYDNRDEHKTEMEKQHWRFDSFLDRENHGPWLSDWLNQFSATYI